MHRDVIAEDRHDVCNIIAVLVLALESEDGHFGVRMPVFCDRFTDAYRVQHVAVVFIVLLVVVVLARRRTAGDHDVVSASVREVEDVVFLVADQQVIARTTTDVLDVCQRRHVAGLLTDLDQSPTGFDHVARVVRPRGSVHVRQHDFIIVGGKRVERA